MSTTKIVPTPSALDSTAKKLIADVGVQGQLADKATGKKISASTKCADYLYSALGWRTETVKAKVEANKERRDAMRALIVSGFSVEKQKLIAITGEALKGLTEAKKKVRREAMQSTGAYFALIEASIKQLEETAKLSGMTDAEKKAAEKVEASKNTEFAKVQKMLQTVLEILQKIEAAPKGTDIPKAVERVKALKGGLPSI
jgi:hypothetical protein